MSIWTEKFGFQELTPDQVCLACFHAGAAAAASYLALWMLSCCILCSLSATEEPVGKWLALKAHLCWKSRSLDVESFSSGKLKMMFQMNSLTQMILVLSHFVEPFLFNTCTLYLIWAEMVSSNFYEWALADQNCVKRFYDCERILNSILFPSSWNLCNFFQNLILVMI